MTDQIQNTENNDPSIDLEVNQLGFPQAVDGDIVWHRDVSFTMVNSTWVRTSSL